MKIVFVYSSIYKGLGSETIYISVYGSTFMPMCSIYEMGWGNVKRNDGCVPKSKTNPQVLSRSPNIFNQKGTSSCRYQYFPECTVKPHTIYDFYIKFRHKVEHIGDRHFNPLPLSARHLKIRCLCSLLLVSYRQLLPWWDQSVGFVPFFNCRENLVWLRWNCVQLPMFSPNQFYEFALQKKHAVAHFL